MDGRCSTSEPWRGFASGSMIPSVGPVGQRATGKGSEPSWCWRANIRVHTSPHTSTGLVSRAAPAAWPLRSPLLAVPALAVAFRAASKDSAGSSAAATSFLRLMIRSTRGERVHTTLVLAAAACCCSAPAGAAAAAIHSSSERPPPSTCLRMSWAASWGVLRYLSLSVRGSGDGSSPARSAARDDSERKDRP